MKVFVLKIITFLLLISTLLFFVFWFVNNNLNHKAKFEISPKTSSIVLGDSHSECAINDALISNLSNYSASGESYFYTYFKAKKIIEQNKNIENIFIEFSNLHTSRLLNEWIWTDDNLSQRYSKYSPFMEIKDHKIIFLNNYRGFLKYQLISSKKNSKKIINKQTDYSQNIGHYRLLNGNKYDFNKVNVTSPQFIKEEVRKLPDVHLLYLVKLISYCKLNGKNVFLVRSPTHKKSKVFESEDLFQKVLLEKFSEIEFLDFVNFPLEDSDFYDLGHLNSNGAIKFSVWFNTLLEKDILYMDNKQELIDKQIKMLENE